jgi:Xaa-Pro aminopeptidase
MTIKKTSALIDQYSGVFLTDGLALDLAKKRYRARRNSLLKTLNEPAIIFGMQSPIQGGNYWLMTHHALYQDPLFLYLTGINQEQTALYLNPKTKEEVLFLSPKNANKEFWDGTIFGLGDSESENEVTGLTGLKTIIPINQLSKFIQGISKDTKSFNLAYFLSEPVKKNQNTIKENTYFAKQQLDRSLKRNGVSVKWVNRKDEEFKSRLCLDNQDISNLKLANNKTAVVFKSVAKALKSYTNETQVAGHIKGDIIKQSAFGESFPAIVACAKNATTLHYHKNNSLLKKNSLLLLDFGLREYQVPSDVSRTIPVNGVFNPLQKCLYTIVLDAQKTVQNAVKPGVTIKTLNTLCWDTLEQLLETRFLKKGGSASREYSKQPHNVSHLIAHCVHDGDPFRNYREMPLEKGMVISNEPGLYGYFELEVEGVLYKEDIGIRIEDDLLLTDSGCENLTKTVPKSIASIEALMA